jgi:hypothetical protein
MGNKLKSNTDKTKLDEAKTLAYEARLNKAEKLAYKLWNLLKEQKNDMGDIPMEERLSI